MQDRGSQSGVSQQMSMMASDEVFRGCLRVRFDGILGSGFADIRA